MGFLEFHGKGQLTHIWTTTVQIWTFKNNTQTIFNNWWYTPRKYVQFLQQLDPINLYNFCIIHLSRNNRLGCRNYKDNSTARATGQADRRSTFNSISPHESTNPYDQEPYKNIN